MRTYELMFILQPDLDQEALKAATEQVQQVITDNGGEILQVKQMGRRRLAYPIRHREAGHYVLLHAEMERPAILEMERYIKLSDDILRHLLIRLEDAQVTAIREAAAAAKAQTEQGAAQTVTEEPVVEKVVSEPAEGTVAEPAEETVVEAAEEPVAAPAEETVVEPAEETQAEALQ